MLPWGSLGPEYISNRHQLLLLNSPPSSKLLAHHTANLNTARTDGCTALYIAAQCGSQDSLRTLLKLGADTALARAEERADDSDA